MKNVSLKTRVEAKMNVLRRENQMAKLQSKIESVKAEQQSFKNPTKNMGSKILENLGSEISMSGNPFKDALTPQDCATIILSELERRLQAEINTQEMNVSFKSESLLLILIDGTWYSIDGNDLKNSILKFARNAGCPFQFIGTELQKLLIEGIVKIWQKLDGSYNEKNRLLE